MQNFDYSFLSLLALEDQFSVTEDTIVHLVTFWISVSTRTRSLSAPDVNSTKKINSEKSLLWDSDWVHPHLPRLMLNQYTAWLAAQRLGHLVEVITEV